MPAIHDLVDLRTRRYSAYPWFHTTKASKDWQVGSLAKLVGDDADARVLGGPGQADAVIIRGPRRTGFLEQDEAPLLIEYDHTSPEAEAWIVDQIQNLAAALETCTIVHLGVEYEAARAALEAAGLGVAKVMTNGVVRTGRAHMEGYLKSRGRLNAFEDAGLRVLTLTEERTQDAVRVTDEVFRALPKFGLMIVDPEADRDALQERFSHACATRFDKRLASDDMRDWIVVDENDVAQAAFGLSVMRGHALYANRASVDIALSPVIHGKGIGPAAYMIMYDAMIELGAEFYHGMTSNPAVLHLGTLVGRTTWEWVMTRGTPKSG